MIKKRNKDSLIFNLLLFLGLSSVFNPAHAYAGPGAAIGAVIIFITIVLAFLGSSILSTLRFLIRGFKIIFKRKKSISEKKSSTRKKSSKK